MRIRSVLAATVLGVALAAAGATTATADAGPRHHHYFGGDEGVCSPYVGGIDTASADIFWAGKHCDRF
ncbi:hypothetical protein [Streptomyces sp. NBC_01235]|uniref:hypothetical protein n=1 Tax=Streptomyces sp. NBC_01235 TaxID=2903788 RepID=UPI002E0D6B94|nr:hypothetical protein OG289_15630 [Streptomyces sp. NBC_01235]